MAGLGCGCGEGAAVAGPAADHPADTPLGALAGGAGEAGTSSPEARTAAARLHEATTRPHARASAARVARVEVQAELEDGLDVFMSAGITSMMAVCHADVP